MSEIIIEKNPSEEKLNGLGIKNWPIWEKEVSQFPWTYDQKEICYLLEGEVSVIPNGGAEVNFGAGDLVIFPKNMSCTWRITKPVRKHYNFE